MNPPPTAMAERVSHTPMEQRVIVHPVSWATYERLLADLANQSSTRLTYDRGTLEIMSPLPEHEEYNRTLALLVEVLASEPSLALPLLAGTVLSDFLEQSKTLKRTALLRAFRAWVRQQRRRGRRR